MVRFQVTADHIVGVLASGSADLVAPKDKEYHFKNQYCFLFIPNDLTDVNNACRLK